MKYEIEDVIYKYKVKNNHTIGNIARVMAKVEDFVATIIHYDLDGSEVLLVSFYTDKKSFEEDLSCCFEFDAPFSQSTFKDRYQELIKENWDKKDDIYKDLCKEISKDSIIPFFMKRNSISYEDVIKSYRSSEMSKNVIDHAYICIENRLCKNNDFVARIDFLFRNNQGSTCIGETLYYFDKEEYEEQVENSYYYGEPINCKRIKDNISDTKKEKYKDVQMERSLN